MKAPRIRLGRRVRPAGVCVLSTSAPSPGRLIGHVVAEYAHGRRLVDVLNDPYVVRHATLEQRRLLLEQPELIRALADDGAADRSGRS